LQIDVATPEAYAKQAIIIDIQDYIHMRFIMADKELVRCAVQKVCGCAKRLWIVTVTTLKSNGLNQ
jgi:hypothetical protein